MNTESHTICYVSSAKSSLTESDLDHLFRVNTRNHTEYDISGILIFNHGNFLQILEGEKQKIKTLFSKICKDSRHSDIIKLIDKPIEARIFDDYHSGMVIVESSKKLTQFTSYLDWIKEAELSNVDKIIRIIENFIDKK